jgi:hypothetical protein
MLGSHCRNVRRERCRLFLYKSYSVCRGWHLYIDLMKPQILDRRVAYTGYLNVATLRVKLGDGAIVSRDIESHGDAAAVLPYDMKRRCALVSRLFRAPVPYTTREKFPGLRRWA